MLVVNNVSKKYGSFYALKDINLEFNNGVYALLAPNGAGKTSIMHAISGLVKPKSGTISFMGDEITKLPAHKIIAKNLAQVPEGRMIVPHFTVKENLEVGAHITNRKAIKDNIDMVGTVIDTAINAGASNVNSIEFGLKDSQVYKDKVLQQAIADAKRKAQVVANSLGKSIVNVVSVNTGSTYIEAKNFNNAMYMRAADATGATSPIQSGDISVRANVSVVFEMN